MTERIREARTMAVRGISGALAAGAAILLLPSGAAAQTVCAPRPPAVAIGAAVDGSLASSDPRRDDRFVDCYRLALKKGEGVQIDLISSAFDPVVDLLAPGGAGEPLRENDDVAGGGRNARINFSAPAAGEYVVRAQGLNGGTGPYVMAITRRDMPPAPPATMLAAGRETQGAFDERSPRNDDGHPYSVYAFDGQAGSRIRIDMISETLDSVLELRREDSAGRTTFSAKNDDGGEGRNARLWAILPETGRYTVLASSLGDEPGPYTIALQQFGPSGPPPPPETIGRGAPVSGRLSFEDRGLLAGTDNAGAISYFYRLYALPLRAGETVTVDFTSTDFDPVLDAGVMSPLGFAAARTDDDSFGTAARLVLTPTESGTVYLRARSLNAETLGDYVLTVTEGRAPPPPSAPHAEEHDGD